MNMRAVIRANRLLAEMGYTNTVEALEELQRLRAARPAAPAEANDAAGKPLSLLQQYDREQQPGYRDGYEDGRLKGFDVGLRNGKEQASARKPLTDAQIEAGRRATFSTDNPFCPCDSKTMRKAARWAERAHGITDAAVVQEGRG